MLGYSSILNVYPKFSHLRYIVVNKAHRKESVDPRKWSLPGYDQSYSPFQLLLALIPQFDFSSENPTIRTLPGEGERKNFFPEKCDELLKSCKYL